MSADARYGACERGSFRERLNEAVLLSDRVAFCLRHGFIGAVDAAVDTEADLEEDFIDVVEEPTVA